MKRFEGVLIWAVILGFIPLYGSAEQPEAASVTPVLKSAALFKNGLGYFIWEVQTPPGAECFTFKPQVAPVHGTCWVSYPPGLKLKDLIATEADSDQAMEAITIPELLKANLGKRVKLYMGEKTLEGKVLRVAENRRFPKPQPYTPGGMGNENDNRIWSEPQLVVLGTLEGETAFPPSRIERVEFLDSPVQYTFSGRDKTVLFRVHLGQPAEGQAMQISCLAKGVSWVPSYFVDISDLGKARISAKALVLNEAADFEMTAISLVTGYPNLLFSDVISPLAGKQSLTQFLRALSSGQSEGEESRVMMMAPKADYRPRSRAYLPAEAPMPDYGSAQGGIVTEDLFLYPLESISLKKDQTGYYPLFTESVPYKHIYQWDIPDSVNEQEQYQYGSGGRGRNTEQPEQEIIWHCLKLENKTKLPWTTAAAQTVKEGMILGQDILNYTPAGTETTLKITQALNIKAEHAEFEIARKQDAARMYGYPFDLITLEGKLLVNNLQDKPVDLEITKTLSGQIKTMTPEAKIEKLAKGILRMNGTSRLKWSMTLPAGEKADISYTYDVYVRR